MTFDGILVVFISKTNCISFYNKSYITVHLYFIYASEETIYNATKISTFILIQTFKLIVIQLKAMKIFESPTKP